MQQEGGEEKAAAVAAAAVSSLQQQRGGGIDSSAVVAFDSVKAEGKGVTQKSHSSKVLLLSRKEAFRKE